MKYSLLFILLMTALTNTHGQIMPKDNPQFDYLKSSRQNRTAATIFLVTGTAATATGLFIWAISPISGIAGTSADVRNTASSGRILTGVGLTFVGVSIPLYNTAKKHNRLSQVSAGATVHNVGGLGAQPAVVLRWRW